MERVDGSIEVSDIAFSLPDSVRGEYPVVLQARLAVEPRVHARLADVHDQEGLVPCGVEELLGDLVREESGHRPGRQTDRTYADDEVRKLQGGVQLRRLDPCVVLGEEDVLRLWERRE